MEVNHDWKLIDEYFKSNEHYISQHHIHSFNDFIENKIPYMIKTLNPFTILKTDEAGEKKHVINVYMGGRDGTHISLSRPCTDDVTGHPVLMYPNVARMQDHTYACQLFADVLLEYTTYENGEEVVFESEEKSIPVGMIPIMLQSKPCILHEKTKGELNELGECMYDQGGYFIIDGKEKVLVSQERTATNKFFMTTVSPSLSSTNEYSHGGLIRCTSKNNLFPKTITMNVFSRDYGDGTRTNAIVLSVPNIKKPDIPLFVIFRALGFITDREIINFIFPDHKNIDEQYLEFIRKSVHEGSFVHTQEDAIDYLKRHCVYKESNFVKHVLKTDLFPNMGDSFKVKAMYLGYLVSKMVRHALGDLDDTNRDSYLYKRVDVTGVLISNMFRDFYNKLRNNIKDTIDKEYTYGSWKNMKEFDIMIRTSKNKIFDSHIITSAMMRSFKGKWGTREEEGIVQDLNRLSHIGYISHVRRVNTPMDRSLKIVSPHKLDVSQWGFMCPIESPDGGNIGLLKHMAVTCHISDEYDDTLMMSCLTANGVLALQYASLMEFTNLDGKIPTRVLLNNNLVGIHGRPNELVRRLKLLKRNNTIHRHTSISWNIFENEIEIFCDAGRCVRPVYVSNGDLQKDIMKTLENNSDSHKWSSLLRLKSSSESLDDADKTPDFLSKTDTQLDKSQSPLEFIDSTETSRSLIAMNREIIDTHPRNTYDYLEIHPSLTLSLYTNMIPLAHHNQAPRNIFSGQQGKQAVGVYVNNFNTRIDTASYVLHYPQKSLLTTKYTKYTNFDRLPNGENIIVAIATYTGYNQEDSVIINKNSIERGMFNTSIYKAHVESEDHNDKSSESIEFANPQSLKKQGIDMNTKYACWDKIDTEGYPKVGSYIEEDDVYVGKVNKRVVSNRNDETLDRFAPDYSGAMDITYTDRSTVAKAITSGTIDAVYVYEKNSKKKLKIRFRKTRTPVLGDKFASRHGQKGVVGMILPQEDMPCTKDGLVPDMIINPHAIPSRMTIGHLIECVIAKYGCVAGMVSDGTVFEHMDASNYYSLLEKHGYNRHGDEVLYNGYTGEQISTKIFMGPTFYCRLKHMVNDKMNYRGGNHLDPVKNPNVGTTKQPSHGRASGGGLRIGEMETNALISHGISHFIQESMMERSDKSQLCVDGATGTSAVEHKHGVKSLLDENSTDFRRVNIPYTMKMLIQEMEALGLKAQICFDNKYEDKNNYYEDAYYEDNLTNDDNDATNES